VADYVQLLAAMDAVFVQPALDENRLGAAPKKARKVMPCDPFILHAVRSWLEPVATPFTSQIQPLLANPGSAGAVVEACIVTHASRHLPTFYIKAEGEVDLAVVSENRFWPVEVKWRTHPKPKDLKQIGKYQNGVIAARTRRRHNLRGTPVAPLPVALCHLGAGRSSVLS
jgi:predicted AAA+ superfamily ATPase